MDIKKTKELHDALQELVGEYAVETARNLNGETMVIGRYKIDIARYDQPSYELINSMADHFDVNNLRPIGGQVSIRFKVGSGTVWNNERYGANINIPGLQEILSPFKAELKKDKVTGYY